MRILLAHASYRVPGGEDRYVSQELDLLRETHEVELLSAENERLGPTVTTAARMLYSRERIAEVEAALTRFRPDVVHVHNVYPGFGPAVHVASARRRTPLVMTVHNYRMRCPNGLMFTEGTTCRRCVPGVYAHAVLHECFPTKQQAGAYAISLWLHRFLHRLERKVAIFIAPSAFMRDELERWGIAPERIHLIRHPAEMAVASAAGTGEFGLYAGRLSPEKGVDTLLRALAIAGDPPFVIAGDGPQDTILRRLAADLGLERARFTGRVPAADVRSLLDRARFLVIPSLSHETASLSALEGLAAGRPLLATRTGALSELVGDDRGMLCGPRDVHGMAEQIRRMMADDDLCTNAGDHAAAFAREDLSPDRHRSALEAAYASAIASDDRGVGLEEYERT